MSSLKTTIKKVSKDVFEIQLTKGKNTFKETLERSELRHLIQIIDNKI